MSQEEPSLLRTKVENLIREYYGKFNFRQQDVISADPTKLGAIGNISVDMRPLTHGTVDEKEREIDKIERLAHVLGDAQLSRIARSLQGLVNIAPYIDQVFGAELTRLLPSDTRDHSREQFAEQYQAVLASQLEHRLLDSRAVRSTEQIIETQDNAAQLLRDYGALRPDATLKTIGTTGALELQRSQDLFFGMLRDISGMNAGRKL